MYEKIKKQSRQFYSEKEYDLALSTAFKLDSHEIENFLIKESTKGHWFQNFDFCNSIAANRYLLVELLSLPRVDELLHKHFECYWKQGEKHNPIPFQLKIAERSSELFVRMLRVSQAFLKNDWYIEADIAKTSDYIRIHQEVWKHLHIAEKKLWGEVTALLNKCINENDLSDILASFVLVIEEDSLKESSDKYLHFLAQVYNAFITILLSRLPENYNFGGEIKQGIKKVVNAQKINSDIRSLYDCMKNWKDFIYTHIDPYCYDLKIEAENENSIISYNRTSEDYYKWELDSTRYVINRLDYLADSLEVIDQNAGLLNKKLLNTPESIEYEFKCQSDYLSLEKLLNDFKLSKFPGGNNLSSERFYQPIIAASNYYKMLYSKFDLLLHQHNDWFAAYQSLKANNPDLFEMENFPFIFSPVEQLYHIHDTQSKIENDKKTKKSTLSQPFTYKAIPGESFDRFNITYEVLKKPFLKLGENIFTPTLFFAKNDWFYAITQNALERLNYKSNIKLRKDTSVEMESSLKVLFEKAGFKAELFHGHEFLYSEGDVDIVASDGRDNLLIQLKRTKLRLNLKEAYLENIQTDRKASRQINNVEKHFTSQKGENYKWIVTTSYENAYKEVDGCLKVNYFDLLTILKTFQNIKNTSIKHLYNRIASDSQIEDVLTYKAVLNPENLDLITLQQYKDSGSLKTLAPFRDKFKIYNAVNLPLPVVEPKQYREARFSLDKTSSSYIKAYNDALASDQKGDFKRAKSLFEDCLNQNPNDFDALAAQAHVLANIELYDQAFTHFEKALKIVPNDLFIKRNYGIALWEAGEQNKAFKIYAELRKQYWYVDIQFLNPIKNFPPELMKKIMQ